jgi:hypothetical protein
MEREPRRKGGERARKTKFEETEMVLAEKTWGKVIGQTKTWYGEKKQIGQTKNDVEKVGKEAREVIGQTHTFQERGRGLVRQRSMRKWWVKSHERQLWERPYLARRRPRHASVDLKTWAAARGWSLWGRRH